MRCIHHPPQEIASATPATKNNIPAKLRSIVGESGKRERYSASVSQWGRSADRSSYERPPLQPIPNFPSRPVLLARGLTRRCPWCGDRRAYFHGWFKRQEHCHRCGHGYRRGDHAFELGATTASFVLTLGGVLVVTLVAILLSLPDIEVWWVVIPAVVVALLGPIVLYPISFTLWQAVDLWMRRPTAEELAGEAESTL